MIKLDRCSRFCCDTAAGYVFEPAPGPLSKLGSESNTKKRLAPNIFCFCVSRRGLQTNTVILRHGMDCRRCQELRGNGHGQLNLHRLKKAPRRFGETLPPYQIPSSAFNLSTTFKMHASASPCFPSRADREMLGLPLGRYQATQAPCCPLWYTFQMAPSSHLIEVGNDLERWLPWPDCACASALKCDRQSRLRERFVFRMALGPIHSWNPSPGATCANDFPLR